MLEAVLHVVGIVEASALQLRQLVLSGFHLQVLTRVHPLVGRFYSVLLIEGLGEVV